MIHKKCPGAKKEVNFSSYVLGIDIGTEGCKVVLFNDNGESLARAYEPYVVEFKQPSWAEQNPQLWWNAVRKCVSTVLKKKSVKEVNVAAVGVTGQSPVTVPVDKCGKPLMKAIIWMDRRAISQTREIAKTTGVVDDASLSLPKILWIKEHKPRVFLKTHKFLQATDFVEFKLTGKFLTDWFSASTFHFDTNSHRWPEQLFKDLKIPLNKLPEAMPPAEVIGTVTEEASKETGLRMGTPVTSGGIDVYMALIGVNALKAGSVCEITGSSTSIMVPSTHQIRDSKGRVHCEKFPLLPNFWITWGTMSTTGAAFRWFRDNFGRPHESFKEMDAEAEKSQPGCDGLVFLPYLMGERSPIWDANARGVFLGFSLSHSRRQFIRSILEGCAFGIRHNLETIEELGATIRDIRSCGGASASRIFGQIKADVTGKSLIIPREIEAPALGAAIAAAVSVKIHKNLREAATHMVHKRCQIDPQNGLKEKYERSYNMYKEAYLHLKRYFQRCHSLSELEQT